MTSVARTTLRILALPGALTCVACDSSDEGNSPNDSPATGGSSSSGGNASDSGGSLGEGEGEGDGDGDGDGDGTGGDDGDGDDGTGGGNGDGTGGDDGGALGPDDDTVNCAALDPARIFPQIGPFLTGPNPGPCTDSDGAVYVYEGGLISEEETYGQSYERDDSGRIVRIVEELGTYEMSYSESAVTWVGPYDGTNQTLTLDVRGYPQRLQIDDRGAVQTVFDYVYEDCRLIAREVQSELPGSVPSAFTYDDEGNLLTSSYGEQVTTYDYSCW